VSENSRGDRRRRLFGGLARNILVAGVVSFFMDVSSEMVYAVTPLFLTALGASATVLGTIEGFAEATAAVLKFFSGVLADRFGRYKPLVTAGYLISALSRPLVATARGAGRVFAGRIQDRFGKGVRTSPRDAILAASADRERYGTSFGFHRAMDQAGAVVGPAVAFLVLFLAHRSLRGLEADAYRPVIWISLVPGLCAVAATLFLKETGRPRRPAARGQGTQTPGPDGAPEENGRPDAGSSAGPPPEGEAAPCGETRPGGEAEADPGAGGRDVHPVDDSASEEGGSGGAEAEEKDPESEPDPSKSDGDRADDSDCERGGGEAEEKDPESEPDPSKSDADPAEDSDCERDGGGETAPEGAGSTRRFIYFLAVMLVFSVGNSSNAFLLLRATDLGLAASLVPLAYAAMNVVYTGVSIPWGVLGDRIGFRRVLIFSLAVYVAVYLWLARADAAWMAWGIFAAYGVFEAAFEGQSRAYLARLAKAHLRGTSYGIYHAVLGLSILLASVVAGLLWDRVSHAAPFYYGAGMAGLALVMLLLEPLFFRERRAG